ncbi:MAG: AMP-dependent synthetase/ligase [bacterium]
MTKHITQLTLDHADNIAELFAGRVADCPDRTAYTQYENGQWVDHTWQETADQVSRLQGAIRKEGLQAGDRIALMCRNSWEWVICDQATVGLGMVLVPVYTNDRPDNIAYIVQDSGATLLILENEEQWESLLPHHQEMAGLKRIVTIQSVNADNAIHANWQEWLSSEATPLAREWSSSNQLATIVYTSGTTGRPKGVMLSHYNILWNLDAGLKFMDVDPENVLLSFLPLSHTLERTVGYYLAMVIGAKTVYNRSIPELAEDLVEMKPTLLVSVPRIFERIYGKIMSSLDEASPVKKALFLRAVKTGWNKFEHDQGRRQWSFDLLFHSVLDSLVGKKVREKLGGRLNFTVCGGAPLSPEVAQLFIGLGIPILQGYGLTETSPMISANSLADNEPDSVGVSLPNIEVKISKQGEILSRSPSVMLGYWNNDEATREIIDDEGWLHTGDKGVISGNGHIRITGRLKEIIVLSNGEKVPPADMENAICLNKCIDQAVVLGEGKPFLAALIVPNQEELDKIAAERGVTSEAVVMEELQSQLADFPGYANVYKVETVDEPWTPDNGMLTPTLKLRRKQIISRYQHLVDAMYEGH